MSQTPRQSTGMGPFGMPRQLIAPKRLAGHNVSGTAGSNGSVGPRPGGGSGGLVTARPGPGAAPGVSSGGGLSGLGGLGGGSGGGLKLGSAMPHTLRSSTPSGGAASAAASSAAAAGASASAQVSPRSSNPSYTLRLVVHPKSFSAEDLILNPKSCPLFRVGDMIEIFHPDASSNGTGGAQASGPGAAGAAGVGGSQQGSGGGAAGGGGGALPRNNLSIPGSFGHSVPSGAANKLNNNSSTASAAAAAASQSTSSPHTALFIKIQSLDPVKANFDISVSSTLADLFHLRPRAEVVVRVVPPERTAVEFVELSFRNQYIGRSDNWRIKHALQSASVYGGASIVVDGMKLRVDEVLAGGRQVKSGLVTSATRFTFRSRSARLFFLVQLSEEMWDFADDGELYFEKVLGFLRILLAEWAKLKVSHALSVIFFSRTFLEVDEEWKGRRKGKANAAAAGSESDAACDSAAGASASASDSPSSEEEDEESDREDAEAGDSDGEDEDGAGFAERGRPPVHTRPQPMGAAGGGSSTVPPRSSGGGGGGPGGGAGPYPPGVCYDSTTQRLYQDHYMVVVDCEHDRSWDDLILLLKRRFNRYHLLLRWGATDPATGLRGFPSTAAEGNFLEAINCVVSVYDKHYLDRDLYKTGQNMVLFSAGIGMYAVEPGLARLTKQRMVDGGIGCDLICMTRPPLHSVPLFAFKSHAGPDEGGRGGSAAASAAHLQREQGRLSRSQTQPLFGSGAGASARRGSHLNAAFHNLQHAIHEGEEHEEKAAGASAAAAAAHTVSVSLVDATGASAVGAPSPRGGVIPPQGYSPRPPFLAPRSEPPMQLSPRAAAASASSSSAAVSAAAAATAAAAASGANPSSNAMGGVVLPAASALHASRVEPSPSPTPSLTPSPSPQVVSPGLAGSSPAPSGSGGSDPSASASPPGLGPTPTPSSSASGSASLGVPGSGSSMQASPAPSLSPMPSPTPSHSPMPSPGQVLPSSSPDALPSRVFSSSAANERENKAERAAAASNAAAVAEAVHTPQYSVPHWLSIYFYDYQDLYDTPFGLLKTSHRDDNSRNRNEEFVSLSSCKLFDFFDLSFFNTRQHVKPSLVPYLPAKELAPPLKPALFDAYDASVFSSSHLPIGFGVRDEYAAPPPSASTQAPALAPPATSTAAASVAPNGPAHGSAVAGTAATAGFAPAAATTGQTGQPSQAASTSNPKPSTPPSGGSGSERTPSPLPPSTPGPDFASASAGAMAPGSAERVKFDRVKSASGSSSKLLGLPKKPLHGAHKSPASAGDLVSMASASAGASGAAALPPPAGAALSGIGGGTSSSSGGGATDAGALPIPAAPLAAAQAQAQAQAQAPAPGGTTSGPNVALQQHMQNPGGRMPTTAFQTRWGHLFGHLYATLDHLHNPLRPNWKSLCQPAVLPLTTDYWPAQAELRLNYSEYNHTLVLVQNQNDYNNDMSALLEEMICQRQAQDYQHIVSDLVPPAKPGTTVYYFSLRNQVHAITWDKRSNTIDVRRHIHKRVIQDRKLVKFPYSYFLFSAHTGSFVNVQRDMEPNRDDPPWSYADNVLCDAHFYADDLSEGLKYRRIHFAIIPAGIPPGKYPASLTDSSGAGGGESAARAAFEAEWRRESHKRLVAFKQFFTLMFSTERGDKIVAAANVAATAAANTAGKDAARIEREAAAAAAAQAALDRQFESFSIELVSPEQDRVPLPLAPLASAEERRANAARVAPVLDTYLHALGFAVDDTPSRELKIPLTKHAGAGAAGGVGEASSGASSSGSSGGSGRYESFQFQYDSVYNPHAVYHMELKWLVATGMHLENWLKNFCKKAETRFGLAVVKIPTSQAGLRTADSFHEPVRLEVPEPAVARMVEEFVVAQCGFVVDSELQGGCRQYVHETGMCALRKLPFGFVWVNNNLPSASQHRKASIALFGKIQRHAQRLLQMRSLVQNLVTDVIALQDMKSSLF